MLQISKDVIGKLIIGVSFKNAYKTGFSAKHITCELQPVSQY